MRQLEETERSLQTAETSHTTERRTLEASLAQLRAQLQVDSLSSALYCTHSAAAALHLMAGSVHSAVPLMASNHGSVCCMQAAREEHAQAAASLEAEVVAVEESRAAAAAEASTSAADAANDAAAVEQVSRPPAVCHQCLAGVRHLFDRRAGK